MRLNNLQALRGVACLLVFFFHVAIGEAGAGHGLNPLVPFQYAGFAGVDLFFVLSGFVITRVNVRGLGDPARVAGYVTRRLWRIYPVYCAC
jgi:peptidoglycan/LPS O-acetylase OafA/YrhL